MAQGTLKHFIFNWHKNEKYAETMTRETKISAFSAKDATAAFMRGFGNLKKNTINFIQEVDKDGEPIGEQILPEA